MEFRTGAVETVAIDRGFWRGKKVFLTGHTGFKGGWLSLWLKEMGADVTGYSLPPATSPSLFEVAAVAEGMTSHFADVRDPECLRNAMQRAAPEIVFHMAAQPLVRASYRLPADTYATNIMGTVHLLEAARAVSGVYAVQVITTDKVYENREWCWPYRENDALGGRDPYSASKAACELVAASYRSSYFSPAGISLSTVRAGNVIGGGDWSEDRLLPDCIRAFASGVPVTIRNSGALRPWQHVLDPLAGYLKLAQVQWVETQEDSVPQSWRYARAYNFGPCGGETVTVGQVAGAAARAWGSGAQIVVQTDSTAPHEAGRLTLEPGLADTMLGWKARWRAPDAVERTVRWYRRFYQGESARDLCLEQIAEYETHLS